ncbi:MAG: hypothetical protein C4522_09640 [Desulfobacteraceae bacterium]|nr:MAG: hypothetical protein C4522_09640 [Desulfobacteraceae bacterium]
MGDHQIPRFDSAADPWVFELSGNNHETKSPGRIIGMFENRISGQGSESANKNHAKMEQAVLSVRIQAS